MIKNILRVCVCVCVCVCGWCVTGVAQEKKEEKKGVLDILKKPANALLHPVRLTGLSDLAFKTVDTIIDGVNKMTDIVITPSRTQEYVYNINKNISVVDHKYIEKTNSGSVQEAIKEQSGVLFGGYLGNKKDSQINMRGFGETGQTNTLVMLDGRRLNQFDLSGSDLSQVDVRSIEQIEIIRGAASVLYGDNAAAGVINMRTKRGQDHTRIEYIQETGSYRKHKEYFSVSGAEKALDFFFSYSYEQDKGFRQNNKYDASNILFNMNTHPSENFDLEFSFGHHVDHYGQPGALFGENISADGRRYTRFPDSKANTQDYFFTLNPVFFYKTDDTEMILSCFSTYRNRKARSRSVSSSVYINDSDLASFEIKPKFQAKTDLMEGKVENKIVFGVDVFRGKSDIVSGNTTNMPSLVDITKTEVGVYAFDKLLIEKKYIVNFGIRGDWANFIFDQTSPSIYYGKQYIGEAAYDVGIGYKYNEDSQVYFDYSRSFRYPVSDEFFNSSYEYNAWGGGVLVVPASLNSDLKNQTAHNFEIGIKDNSFDLFNLQADYFFIDTKEEIFYDPISYKNMNYKNTFRHGLEFQAKIKCIDTIDAFITYTYQKAKFKKGDYSGKDIPFVPTHQIGFGFDIRPVPELNINIINNFVGSSYLISDVKNVQAKLKGHFVTDINLDYKIKHFRITGSVKNLFDQKYFLQGSYNSFSGEAFYPAPERRYEVTASLSF